jgi:hypothetical protein
MTPNPTAGKLRQDIHAIWNRKYGYPEWVLKDVMRELGFGESLRALDEDRLSELKRMLVENRRHGRPEEFTYDKQGMFMFSLLKRIGWTEADLRFHLIKRYSKTHWNVLDRKERRGVIAMLLNYLNKQECAHGDQGKEAGADADRQSGPGNPGEGDRQGDCAAGQRGPQGDGTGDPAQ